MWKEKEEDEVEAERQMKKEKERKKEKKTEEIACVVFNTPSPLSSPSYPHPHGRTYVGIIGQPPRFVSKAIITHSLERGHTLGGQCY
jgi:hypothetical protein